MSHDHFELESPIYHQSQIDMFLRCGKQFEFRYIKGIKTPPAAVLTVGSSVDAAVTHNLEQKITTGHDLPVDEVLDACETTWNKLKNDTDFTDTSEGVEKDIAVRLTRLHHLQAAPFISPKEVQWEFDIETERGYRVGGTADIVDTGNTVEDTKTANKSYAATSIANKLQPALYTWARQKLSGKEVPTFRYRVLVKPQIKASEKIQVLEAPVSKSAQEWFFKIVDLVHESIKKGNFLPAQPDSWVCSERFCGYWSICRGKK